jgi:flagellar biosynthesis protein FlhB
MDIIFKFLVRALLVVVGLVFAASLIIVMLVLLVLWSLRAVWCKLTGQPINPFVMRMNPRAGFDKMYQSTTRKPARVRDQNVVDVEAKDLDTPRR